MKFDWSVILTKPQRRDNLIIVGAKSGISDKVLKQIERMDAVSDDSQFGSQLVEWVRQKALPDLTDDPELMTHVMSVDTPWGDYSWLIVYGLRTVKSPGKFRRVEYVFCICDARSEGPEVLLDLFGYAEYLNLETR